MKDELYSKLYLLENKDDIHMILNDKGLYIVSEKHLEKSDLYDLFIIKTYEACQSLFQEFKETPSLIENMDMDGFLDMYSISKNEYEAMLDRIKLLDVEEEEDDSI